MRSIDRHPESSPYFIGQIMLPNMVHISIEEPHRLYAHEEDGGWLEIWAQKTNIQGGLLIGIKRSGGGETNKKIDTFHVEKDGSIYRVDPQGGYYRSGIEEDILYMLLNPLPQINGWRLYSLAEAKREHTFDTGRALGIKTNWGHTRTFHPDLEPMMQQVRDMVQGRIGPL